MKGAYTMSEAIINTQSVATSFNKRVSKPRFDKIGVMLSEGGRDLGTRLNLMGGEEANKFGTIADFKAHIRATNPNLSNREVKNKVSAYFSRKDVKDESEVQATVALQYLHQQGFQAQNLDITKTGKSATIRLHRPDTVNPAEMLMSQLIEKHGVDGAANMIKQHLGE